MQVQIWSSDATLRSSLLTTLTLPSTTMDRPDGAQCALPTSLSSCTHSISTTSARTTASMQWQVTSISVSTRTLTGSTKLTIQAPTSKSQVSHTLQTALLALRHAIVQRTSSSASSVVSTILSRTVTSSHSPFVTTALHASLRTIAGVSSLLLPSLGRSMRRNS